MNMVRSRRGSPVFGKELGFRVYSGRERLGMEGSVWYQNFWVFVFSRSLANSGLAQVWQEVPMASSWLAPSKMQEDLAQQNSETRQRRQRPRLPRRSTTPQDRDQHPELKFPHSLQQNNIGQPQATSFKKQLPGQTFYQKTPKPYLKPR